MLTSRLELGRDYFSRNEETTKAQDKGREVAQSIKLRSECGTVPITAGYDENVNAQLLRSAAPMPTSFWKVLLRYDLMTHEHQGFIFVS